MVKNVYMEATVEELTVPKRFSQLKGTLLGALLALPRKELSTGCCQRRRNHIDGRALDQIIVLHTYGTSTTLEVYC